MERILLFFAATIVSVACAEKVPFDDYQKVIDRYMFGVPPNGFDATKLPSEVAKADQKQLSQEQEKLKSSIHFSVINVTPEGSTAVGFTDKTDPKVPVHYYLKVGETRNGWKVIEADANTASMTIAKGDIEVSLKLGGDSSKDAGATMKKTAETERRSNGLLGGSLGARRRLRAQEAQAAQEKAEKAAADREAERQAQAEAEKAQREQERAEQRQQLQAIQEELKRVREAKAAEKKDEPPTDSSVETE